MDENNKIINFVTENNKSSLAPVEPSLQQYATGAPALGYSVWTILGSLEEFLDTSMLGMEAVGSLSATNSELSLDASNNQTTKLNSDNQDVQDATDSDSIQQAQSQFSTDQTAYQVPMTVLQGLSQLLSQLQTTVAQAQSLVGSTASAMINTVRSYGTAS